MRRLLERFLALILGLLVALVACEIVLVLGFWLGVSVLAVGVGLAFTMALHPGVEWGEDGPKL